VAISGLPELFDRQRVDENYASRYGYSFLKRFFWITRFSTYESIYRAKLFSVPDGLVIVTLRYHLHRELYIDDKFKLEAVGLEADRSRLMDRRS
jgi:vancomycin permeability regulator SanA